MQSKVNKFFNLILFIILTNTFHLKAHDSFNGGCKDHCKKSITSSSKENNLFNKNKKQIEDNFSCLNKSLCRG